MSQATAVRWKQALFAMGASGVLIAIVVGSVSGTQVLEGRVVRESVMISAETAGRVEALLVKDGDWVEPGASLLQLDTADLQSERSIQRAREALRLREYEHAQTQLAEVRRQFRGKCADAQTQLDRLSVVHRAAGLKAKQAQDNARELKQAMDKGAVARDEYEKAWTHARIATLAIESATIDLQAAKRSLRERMEDGTAEASVKAMRQAEAALAQATVESRALDRRIRARTLRAPVAGRVREGLIRVGEYAGVAQALVRLEPPTAAWVEVNMPEAQAAQVTVGQSVTLLGEPTPWQILAARVRVIAPATSLPVGTPDAFTRLLIAPEGHAIDHQHGHRMRVLVKPE